MKILILSSIGLHGVGGSSNVIRGISEHLAEVGHELTVLTFYPAAEEKINGLNFKEYGISPKLGKGFPSLIMFLYLIFISIFQRPNLILCGIGYPSAILAYFSSLISRLNYVVLCHGEDVTCVGNKGIKFQLLKLALNKAQKVLTVSNYTKNIVESLGVPEEKIVVTPPWVDETAFRMVSTEDINELRTKLGLTNKRVILTVARLEKRKGHDTVIQTLKPLRQDFTNIHYLIVGYGSTTELEELAKKECVDDILTIIDYVDAATLTTLFNLCEIYVMVSRWDPVQKHVEGFGIVYLEAAAAGKPSIAGNNGGCSDAVENGLTGIIVNSESVEETEDALKFLLSNKALAEKMGEAGYLRARTYFNKKTRLEIIEANILS